MPTLSKPDREEILRRYREKRNAARGPEVNIDLAGLFALLKKLWRPSKWRKLVEELEKAVQATGSSITDIRAELILIRKLLEELLAALEAEKP